MKTKDISQIVVGLLVMLSFMVVLWAVFKIEMPAPNRDLALILLGVLASKFGDVVAYHFNSSKGSSEKTDIISKLPPVSVLLLPLLLLGLASCGTPQKLPVTEVPIQYKEKIVERLVPVEIPADSAIIAALFACDSTNQVYLKELSEKKSGGQSNSAFKDGKLTYKLIIRHDTVFVQAKDSIIYKEIPVKIPVEVRVNFLTKWQGFQIVGFRVLAVALVLWLFLKYWKNKVSTVFKTLFNLKN